VIKKDWTINNKVWIQKIKDQGQGRGSEGRSKSHHKNSASSRFEPKK
jgi:hypothetical protein